MVWYMKRFKCITYLIIFLNNFTGGNFLHLFHPSQSDLGIRRLHHFLRSTGQVLGARLQHQTSRSLQHSTVDTPRPKPGLGRQQPQLNLLRTSDPVVAEQFSRRHSSRTMGSRFAGRLFRPGLRLPQLPRSYHRAGQRPRHLSGSRSGVSWNLLSAERGWGHYGGSRRGRRMLLLWTR